MQPRVRGLENLESVIDQLFPATLLARLGTLHAATDVKAVTDRKSKSQSNKRMK